MIASSMRSRLAGDQWSRSPGGREGDRDRGPDPFAGSGGSGRRPGPARASGRHFTMADLSQGRTTLPDGQWADHHCRACALIANVRAALARAVDRKLVEPIGDTGSRPRRYGIKHFEPWLCRLHRSVVRLKRACANMQCSPRPLFCVL